MRFALVFVTQCKLQFMNCIMNYRRFSNSANDYDYRTHVAYYKMDPSRLDINS